MVTISARHRIEDVTFPEGFGESMKRCVMQRGLETQFFVVIQELNEVSDLLTRLGRIGRGGRDSGEAILRGLPGELADALFGLGFLMEYYAISPDEVSRILEEKLQLMNESLTKDSYNIPHSDWPW